MIDIQDVSFGYEGRKVLERVSLSLKPNQCYAVIGPNGGGKTTLLQLLMGFLTPHTGHILIDKLTPKAFREHIGYVPQTPSFDRLFPISVEQLVFMGLLSELSPLGFWNGAAKAKVRRALELVQLTHKADASIGELSGGQVQRAYIARAIVNHPKLLLLDEPTASLDVEVSREILKLLKALKQEMTIIIVSHDLDSVVELADLVIYVHNQVNLLETRNVCHHFSMGVYHQQ